VIYSDVTCVSWQINMKPLREKIQLYAKHYEHLTLVSRVIAKTSGLFFATQCRFIVYVNYSITITRNSSGDEIANANFIYDDIVHAVENTIDRHLHKFRHRSFSATQVYRIQ